MYVGAPLLGGAVMQNLQLTQKQLPVTQIAGAANLTNNQPFVSAVLGSSVSSSGIMASGQLPLSISNLPSSIGNSMGEFPPQMLLSSGQGGSLAMMSNGIGIGVPLSMQQGTPMPNGINGQISQGQKQNNMILGGMQNPQMGGGINPNINQQVQAKHYLPPQGQQQQQQMQQQMYQQQQMQQHQRSLPNGQQAAQGQSQQQMTLSGARAVRKPWHTQEDAATRNSMIERIVGLLQQRRPNATSDWQEKLPHMAKRLENELYQQAESVGEYSDPSTLKNRLQLLALSMGSKQAAKQSLISNSGQPGPQGQSQSQVQGSNLMIQSQGQVQGQQGQVQGQNQNQGQYSSQQQSQSQMMQQQHQQHLHLQQQQSQQNPGTHMRTAQAAASQYPGQMGQQGGLPVGNGYGYNGMDSQGHPQQQVI